MRLISEDAFEKVITDRMIEAIEWWRETPTPEIKSRTDQMVATFCEALMTAKTLPTVDAVEVVRCRDCVFYWDELRLCCNEDGLAKASEETYCPYGERRDK